MSKIQNFNLAEVIRYIPAVLQEQKSGDWRIVYHAIHPQTKELAQVRIRVNKIKTHYPTKPQARRHIAEMCQMINAKLSGGWSPFFEGEDARLYTVYTQVIAEFLESKSREMRPATIRSYQSFCKMISEWLDIAAPKMYFSMFNHYWAIRYMDYLYLKRKIGNTTYNNQLKMGKVLCNWSVERCYSKTNPFDKIKPKRKEQKTRTIIPADVCKQISEHYEQNKNYGMLLVCNLVYSSLIRPKEIRNLKIENVNIADKCISVPCEVAKNHKQRFAALSENSIKILEQWHCFVKQYFFTSF